MKADLPRRSLFKTAWPMPAANDGVADDGPAFARALLAANKSEPRPRGRPIVSTGDPKRDARNAQQRELMRKRRAAK